MTARLALTPAARRTTLLLISTIYGMGFIDRIVIALVAQQIKADFAVSDFAIGLLGGTAFAIVNALAGLPLARLAERWPRKWIAAGSLAVASLFTLLCGATTGFAQLLALRLGMAGGSAGTEAPAHSMISDLYPPERRASAISLFMLGVPVAAIAGSWIAGGIAEAHGWRAAFLTIGVIGAGVALLASALVREPVRAAPSQGDAAPAIFDVLRVMLGSRVLRHVLLGVTLVSLGGFGVNTFLPAYFARNFAMGPARAGLVFGMLSGCAALLGSLAGGYGSEWLARRNPQWLLAGPAIGVIVGAPLFALGLFQARIELALALMFVGSISFYTAMGPAIASLHELLNSRSRATGSALFLLVMHLVGQGLGPPLAGWISDTGSAIAYGGLAGQGFAQHCMGIAGQVAGSDCARAGAVGVRYAMACFMLFNLAGGLHLVLAGRRREARAAASGYRRSA